MSQLPGEGWGALGFEGECARRGPALTPTLGPLEWDTLRDTQVTDHPSLSAPCSCRDSQDAVLIFKNSVRVRLSCL